MLDSRKIRYLLTGGWNTLFGYLVGVGLYYVLSRYMHILLIGVLINIITISMSFLTYKLIVFRTKGNWLMEYLRTYLVYGGTALISVGLLWAMVDGFHLPFWLAQGLVMAITVVISYLGHANFTFRSKVSRNTEVNSAR